MNRIEIGEIQEVQLRQVWPHEAQDFTPWLVQNIQKLNEPLGMDLIHPEYHQPVGNFELDITCQNSFNGEIGIIENQLTPTDHKHLGQIILYQAYIKPGFVVWIVSDVKDEYISALNYQNEVSDVKYYLIKLSAIRIGDSSVAPKFEVIVRPNGLQRQMKNNMKSIKTTTNDNLKFWDLLQNKIQNGYLTKYISSVRRSNDSVMDISLNRAGCFIRLKKLDTFETINVELLIENPTNEILGLINEKLKDNQNFKNVMWIEDENVKRKRLPLIREIDTKNENNFSECVEWLIKNAESLHKTVYGPLQESKKK